MKVLHKRMAFGQTAETLSTPQKVILYGRVTQPVFSADIIVLEAFHQFVVSFADKIMRIIQLDRPRACNMHKKMLHFKVETFMIRAEE